MWTRRAMLIGAGAAAGCAPRPRAQAAPATPATPAEALAAAARRQLGVTTGYDPRYHVIPYPGGDLPRSTGVCSDVLVRAARDAWGLDLQKLVHEDMAGHFRAYPQRWGLKAPDPSIDHRRAPNLETWLTRRGTRLWTAGSTAWGVRFPGPFEAGDILTWRCYLSNGPHVGIVVEGGGEGEARIVENKGGGVREAPLAVSFEDAAVGHFRWVPGRGRG